MSALRVTSLPPLLGWRHLWMAPKGKIEHYYYSALVILFTWILSLKIWQVTKTRIIATKTLVDFSLRFWNSSFWRISKRVLTSLGWKKNVIVEYVFQKGGFIKILRPVCKKIPSGTCNYSRCRFRPYRIPWSLLWNYWRWMVLGSHWKSLLIIGILKKVNKIVNIDFFERILGT